jgi:DNA-binding MarR family transcriptional regulator
MTRSGADLALLLLGGFRSLVDAAVIELAARGYEDVRPVHDFAMRAIVAGADSASELGRRLSVSKQAAARTILVLQERGYVGIDIDPLDARKKKLQVTKRGFDVMREGEAIFDELREQWIRQIGAAEVATLERNLATLVGNSPARVDDIPRWAPQNAERTAGWYLEVDRLPRSVRGPVIYQITSP